MRLGRFRPIRLRRSPALIVAVLALCISLGGVAWATIPDSSGVIHGCYIPRVGVLRVIDTEANPAEKCVTKLGEVPLNWNQTGPQGQKGDTGPQGPAGPQGPQGPGSKTIAGLVNADGTKFAGSGFTSTRNATGRYTISFPPGTWNGVGFPVMTVTPWGANGGFVDPIIASFVASPDGSASFDVVLSNTVPNESDQDNAFDFTAFQGEAQKVWGGGAGRRSAPRRMCSRPPAV
jgi:hypothetical protein